MHRLLACGGVVRIVLLSDIPLLILIRVNADKIVTTVAIWLTGPARPRLTELGNISSTLPPATRRNVEPESPPMNRKGR